MTTLVLALRGAAAIGVLTTLAGGIPRLVQVGLALAVGLWSALIVGAPDGAAAVPVGFDLAIVAARELVLGATLGLVAVIPIVAMATAGRFVDRAGGGAGAARGAYRGLFGILAAAIFVGIDGHVRVVTTIVESFRDVPALAVTHPRVLDAIGALVGAAVQLAIPWLVTAAVVEIAVGVGLRVAGRAGTAVPGALAVPAALVMMTATLVGTLAVAFAALVRGAL